MTPFRRETEIIILAGGGGRGERVSVNCKSVRAMGNWMARTLLERGKATFPSFPLPAPADYRFPLWSPGNTPFLGYISLFWVKAFLLLKYLGPIIPLHNSWDRAIISWNFLHYLQDVVVCLIRWLTLSLSFLTSYLTRNVSGNWRFPPASRKIDAREPANWQLDVLILLFRSTSNEISPCFRLIYPSFLSRSPPCIPLI